MKEKIITVKLASMSPYKEKGKEDDNYFEYEFPKLNKHLDDGWKVDEVYQSTTNVNVGFLFITFLLKKGK